MTRAERFVTVERSLYILNRLRKFTRLSRYHDEKRRELMHERDELRRQMGGAERRELARLQKAVP